MYMPWTSRSLNLYCSSVLPFSSLLVFLIIVFCRYPCASELLKFQGCVSIIIWNQWVNQNNINEYEISRQKRRGLWNACIYKVQRLPKFTFFKFQKSFLASILIYQKHSPKWSNCMAQIFLFCRLNTITPIKIYFELLPAYAICMLSFINWLEPVVNYTGSKLNAFQITLNVKFNSLSLYHIIYSIIS